MTRHVIETVIFSLVSGVDPIAFAKSAEAVTAYVNRCQGFISRRLSRAEDGSWIEHIEWEGMDAAKAAAAGIGKDPGNAEFLKAIDGPSVKMMHSTLEVSVN